MTDHRVAAPAVASSTGAPRLPVELEQVVAGEYSDPHQVLGLHDGVVRAYRPDALAMRVLVGSQRIVMTRIHPAGLFEAAVPPDTATYRLEADYGQAGHGSTAVFDDPYRHWPTVGELDLHLLGEGRHRRLWEVLGAHYGIDEDLEG